MPKVLWQVCPVFLGKNAHVCGKHAKFGLWQACHVFRGKHAPGFVASVPSYLGKHAHVCGKRAKFSGQECPCLWQACQVFRGKHAPGFVASTPRNFLDKHAQCFLSLAIWGKQTLHIYYLNYFIMLAFCPIWELAKVCGNKYSGLTVPTNHNNVSLIVSVSCLRIMMY